MQLRRVIMDRIAVKPATFIPAQTPSFYSPVGLPSIILIGVARNWSCRGMGSKMGSKSQKARPKAESGLRLLRPHTSCRSSGRAV